MAALLMPVISLLVGVITLSVIHGGLEKLAAGFIVGIVGCLIGVGLGIASRWRRERDAWMGYTGLALNGLPLLIAVL